MQPSPAAGMARNVSLYPWFRFFQNLLFWQAVWFLFFQAELSGAEAIALYAVYDIGTMIMEVPSGYMSDRLGRRPTLIASALAGAAGAALIALGDGFWVFALAQVLLGASAAFASGTDSSLLYESLAAEGQEDRIEAEETRGWQYSLVALALSALIGGIAAQWSFGWTFAGGALAQCVCVWIAWQMTEPPHGIERSRSAGPVVQYRLFRAAMGKPVLVWLFVLSLLMYGFSHVPFVFGQPFIAEALALSGWTLEAPLVSGTVTALMMGVSVLATLVALRLRRAIGLPAMLLMAFAIQIGLIAVLGLSGSLVAVAVLLLRMVPNSFSRPFIIARMQPLLSDAGRATFLSVQSFLGRVLFAGSLLLASAFSAGQGALALADLQWTLGVYALFGSLCLIGLALTVRRAQIAGPRG